MRELSDELFAPAGLQWQGVSPRYVAQQGAVAAVLGLVVAVVLGVVALVAGGAAAGAGGFVVGLLVAAVLVVTLRRRAATWRYALREQDLFLAHGLMFRELVAVPYGRMQAVEVSAGPLARAFSLAEVRLVTASPRTGAVVPGLDRPTATLLRDRLAELGEAAASGL